MMVGSDEQTEDCHDDEDREPTSNVALRAAYEAYERAIADAPHEEHGRRSFIEYTIDMAVDAAVVIERERTVAAVMESLREDYEAAPEGPMKMGIGFAVNAIQVRFGSSVSGEC